MQAHPNTPAYTYMKIHSNLYVLLRHLEVDWPSIIHILIYSELVKTNLSMSKKLHAMDFIFPDEKAALRTDCSYLKYNHSRCIPH